MCCCKGRIGGCWEGIHCLSNLRTRSDLSAPRIMVSTAKAQGGIGFHRMQCKDIRCGPILWIVTDYKALEPVAGKVGSLVGGKVS